MCLCCHRIYTGRHRFVHVPAGVTQEEDHSGFLLLTSAVLALVFFAKRIQPLLSLVDREVECCLLIIYIYIYIYICVCVCILMRKNPSLCDCAEIRTHVPKTTVFHYM